VRLTDLRHDVEHLFLHVLLGRSRQGGTVNFERDGMRYRTAGLRAALAHPELEAEVSDERLLPGARAFLVWIVDYINRTHARIQRGETLGTGFWMVKFFPLPRGNLEAWDLVPGTTDSFQPKIDISLTFDQSQQETAERHQAAYDPPSASKLFSADPGVLQGRRIVELLRDLPASKEHSGWFIFSEGRSGNFVDLKDEHLYHLAAWNAEIVRFLGLAPGWHVDLGTEERAWFEEPPKA
jgi:hypothetical protein